jgi:YspA, cpYpsA-related SLOG family
MNMELPREVKRDGTLTIVVFGGRNFNDENLLFEALDTALMQCELRELRLLIVEGGATGADAVARAWAGYQDGSVDLATERAEWRLHGRAAGPRRNQLMIDKYNPDFYISAPGGKGTADMTRRCAAAGIPGYAAGPIPSSRTVQTAQ